VVGTRTLSIFFGFQICHPSTHREVGSPECGFLVIIARSRDVHISGSKSFAVCIAENSLRLVFVAHVEIFGLLLARSRQVSVCGVSQFLFSADLHIVVFDLGVVDVVLSRCRRIVLDFFIEEFASRQDRYAYFVLELNVLGPWRRSLLSFGRVVSLSSAYFGARRCPFNHIFVDDLLRARTRLSSVSHCNVLVLFSRAKVERQFSFVSRIAFGGILCPWTW